MATANLVTESLGMRYSDSVMGKTIADAIADSKYQFTKCYRRGTIQAMNKKPKLESTPSVEILKKMVAACGGPAKFARTYSRDDADDPIDPTFVSQIINGHRAFRDQARINMARRAGLPDDHFEKAVHEVKERAVSYDFEQAVIAEANVLLKSLPIDWQRQAVGAIRIIVSQYNDQIRNPIQRAAQ